MVRKSDNDAIMGMVKLSGFSPRLNVMRADPNDIRVKGIMRKEFVKITMRIDRKTPIKEKAYVRLPIIANTLNTMKPAEKVPKIYVLLSYLLISLREGLMFPKLNFVVIVEAMIEPSSPTESMRQG